MEAETENDNEAEEYHAPAQEPCAATGSRSLVISKNNSSIGERLVVAVEPNELELCAPRVVMETPLTDEREEGQVTVAEQCPDLTTVDTTESFVRIKELAERMCPQSTLG